jgi:diguanylate cyclase (GGDEF)-like protein/PAS domain S-box-containing protein
MQDVVVHALIRCPDPAPRPRACAELATQNATLLLDAGGIIRWCSEPARQLLARPVQSVVGRPIAEFAPALALNEDTPGYNAAYVAFSFGEDNLRACRVLDGTADAFDADLAVSPVRLGDARGFVVALHRSCDPLVARIDMQRFLESLATDEDAVLIVDEEGRVAHANPAFEALTGFLQAEVIGEHADTLTADVATGRFTQRSAWLQQGRHVRGTTTCLRRDGTRMHVDETMRTFVDAQRRITHYVLRLRDASDRVAAAERVAYLAHHDMLTGLPNRALFADRLQQEIARSVRRNAGFALLCLDLDGFKLVNDRYGHAAGDEVLRGVAQRLRESVREEDTVARLGGDEFAVILPGAATRAEVEATCRSVAPRLAAGLSFEGIHFTLSLSAGVATFPADGRDGDTLVRAADRAMYSAKRTGGNRCHFAGDTGFAGAEPTP